ncbi:RNA-binding protein 44 isoform X2 [Rhincodon typus]|uniref:RNA-binding protein 44 isoform X2 n=1 Tax=Rhincodon typus TaxID=259920 RepID=UPI00202E1F9D|nr:RNA-binding protein 44 isoform X2 [Rhincodon typus]
MRMQSELIEDLREPRMSSALNKSKMPTFYCIWPCEKCSYCNALSTQKCKNCSEPIKDGEQPLYLEDKNMLLAHNQRILASFSTAEKAFLRFRAVSPNPERQKTNEGICDKPINQLFDSRMKPHTFDRVLTTQRAEEIAETKSQFSDALESAYETHSSNGSSVVEDLTKETDLVLAVEQEKNKQKLVLMKEYGNESTLSLDTEFEMYRKLNEMNLEQAASDCFQEGKRETLHQYIPECKDLGRLNIEPFPDADAQNPAESNQFARCIPPVEEIDETSFISAVTSTPRSFIHENNEIAICECAERSAETHLLECKSAGTSESAFNDGDNIGPNGSMLEQVEGSCNNVLQTNVLLESVNLREGCFLYQDNEFANDQSTYSTSIDIESESQVPLVPFNTIETVTSTNIISKAEDILQNSNTECACESPDRPGWEMTCELTAVSYEMSADLDERKFFDDSFVSAAEDSIVASVAVADHYCDVTSQVNDVFEPLEITEDNRFINCVTQTSDLTAPGGGTLLEGTCPQNQVKCDNCWKKSSKGLIMKVNQYIDACTDFRTDFTMDKDTTAVIPVVDRADNTDITLMSKNRPTLGQSRKYGNVACNTKWSIVESTVKQQSTQTAKVTTEEKSINTVLQTTDFNSYSKELGPNQCKTKLRKVLGELEELKKKCKSTELQQQCSLYLSVTEDGNHSSDCCSSMKQRAIKAELQLLKMQYWMCQQHCWRAYNMAVEERGFRDLGLSFLEVGTEYGTTISSALQELKTNYQSTMQKVLEGMTLDNLPLLSVELEGLSNSPFVPAMLGDQQPICQYQKNSNYREQFALKEIPSREIPARKLVEDQDKTDIPSGELQTNHYQHVGHRVKAETDCESIVKQAKDPEVTDDWFDAEENFTASSGFSVMQMKANKGGTRTTEDDRISNDASTRIDEETVQTCYVYMDGLPGTVTESELRNLFQKYQVTGIWLCSLHSDYRCGVLRVTTSNYAKLAVDEMNGKEYHGKPIKVHLAKISGDHVLSVLKNHSQPSLNVHTLKDHATKDTNFKGQNQWEPCTPPLSTRVLNTASHKINRRKYKQMQCVQDIPTATGTFIPPNSANLSSFNKLMKTLLEMHPEANRNDIIQALKEVKSNNKGFLSGLALNTIVQLASAILKRQLSTNNKE